MSHDQLDPARSKASSKSLAFHTREYRGIGTRVLLIAATAVILATATLVSLLAIRRQLQRAVTANLSADLLHSIATFEEIQAQRIRALDRENSLLADLPSLKALMTTSDQRTIEDGAVEFWKVGRNDLFAVADRDGRVVAAFAEGAPASPARSSRARKSSSSTSRQQALIRSPPMRSTISS